MEIIKLVQRRYFRKEVVLLSKQKKLKRNNRLFKFRPYVDAQSVLRIPDSARKTNPATAKGWQSHIFNSHLVS